jgi:dipeptidyl aminopeptidase/acylaminoacyl peptidase
VTAFDERISAWLAAREPGTPPESLRASIAEVPYAVRQAPLSRLTDALPWPSAAGSALRMAAILLAVALLSGVLAVLALLTSRPERGPLAQNGLMAFIGASAGTGGSGDVYLVNEDGSGLRRLTDTDEPELSPAFSPDGSRLAYLRGRACPLCGDDHVGIAQVVVIDVASGRETLAADVPIGDAWSLAWSPDGRSIVAHSQGSSGGWSTSSVDLESGAWEELTRSLDAPAAWSPDGDWLLVIQGDVFAIRADAVGHRPVEDPSAVPGVRQLTDDGRYKLLPSWAPDSGSVLFMSTAQSWAPRIEVVELTDPKPRVLADAAFSAVWSPSGASVAYLRGDRATPTGAEVWVADADGSHARRVARSFTPPKWSPDGTLLYLFGEDSLFAVDATGSGELVHFMPEEFWPQGFDLEWLAAIEQLEGAYGSLGGADWQSVR